MSHAERLENVEITGLTADSRQVAPGYLFAALPGTRADGRAFIGEAVRRGAVALLAPTGTPAPDAAIPLIEDANPRRRLALMAAAFHHEQPRTIAAVTGTNGKTSVAVFTRQIWAALGHKAAALGTLGIIDADGHRPGALTTPDPVVLHATLADLARHGVDHLVLEASSHGLDQYRLDGVRIGAAAFTNLSHDHLDYHGSMAAYLASKQRLFTEVMAPGGVAVLNADAPQFEALRAACIARGHRILSTGRAGADIRLAALTPTAQGLRLDLVLSGTAQPTIEARLVGAFQADNLMAALGLAIGCGADPAAALAACGGLSGAPGRLELAARHPAGAPVYVDYAHTPGALETVLLALRPHVRGHLVVVFGCGGDRDRAKRPLMGDIAARLADRAIVTDDNPRGEDPAAIRAAILPACPAAEEIGDRGAAIRRAVRSLQPDDVLLIAGKGHETYQIIGDDTLDFDDRAVARAAVAEIEAGAQ